MAGQSEAQCLIEQGAMFPRRQGFRDEATGSTILIGFKPGGCSIYFDDEPIYHFDLDGRWQRAFIGCDPHAPDSPKNLAGVPGVHYLKALDTTTTSLVRVREGAEIKIRRRPLNFAETVEMDDRVRHVAMTLHEGVARGKLRPIDPPASGRTAGQPMDSSELLDFFERVAAWDTTAWSRQKENFMATYGPQPMSPPICPGPIVLQATLGDSGDKGIGFGGGRSTPLYVRDSEEFERHVRRVVALWGRRLTQARGIHLAGSDLLLQPMPKVIDTLDTTARMLAEMTIDVVGRTIDPPRTLQKFEIHLMTHHLEAQPPTVEMFVEYRRRGLAHLTIGVESTREDVLAAYGRHWRTADLFAWLNNAAEAELPVSIVWLVGAGGEEFPEDVEESAATLTKIPWAPGTVIYLLDGSETAQGAIRGRLRIAHDNSAAAARLLRASAETLKARRVKLLSYTLEKEWH